MLIAPQGEYTVTDTYHTNRFGWLGLAAGDEPLRQPTDVVRPGTADYEALVAANADRSIRMDDGSSHDWTNFSFTDHQTRSEERRVGKECRAGFWRYRRGEEE